MKVCVLTKKRLTHKKKKVFYRCPVAHFSSSILFSIKIMLNFRELSIENMASILRNLNPPTSVKMLTLK